MNETPDGPDAGHRGCHLQLVIASIFRVPQKHPARSMVDVPYPDRRVLVQLVSVDLHATTPGQ
jgi:hypothetical protein